MQRAHTRCEYLFFASLFASNELPPRLARCNLTDPCEFTSSRISRPKCAPTAEVFGNLPSYLEYVNSSPREEELDGENDENDNGRILSPLKKRQRRKLRESAGVNAKSSRRHRTSVVGPSDLKARTSLPPVGRMQCLWGSNCTTRMDFDYTFKTIKDWKNHIASHLVKPSKPTEDSVGRGQMVKILKCSWGGCSANVEKGYLFKHIVTHEVRFKLLCPRGCGVAIRDDNLERHLKSCRLDG